MDVDDNEDDHFIDDENGDGQIDDDDDYDDDTGNTVLHGRKPNEPGAQQQHYRIPRALRMQRVALARLPTGLSHQDVEREMEHAVVEIASNGDDDGDGGIKESSSDMEDAVADRRQTHSQTQGKGRESPRQIALATMTRF